MNRLPTIDRADFLLSKRITATAVSAARHAKRTMRQVPGGMTAALAEATLRAAEYECGQAAGAIDPRTLAVAMLVDRAAALALSEDQQRDPAAYRASRAGVLAAIELALWPQDEPLDPASAGSLHG